MNRPDLLTLGNPKTAKGEAAGYQTAVMHLAPGTLSGWNVCPGASAGCLDACLNTAGRGGIMRKGCATNPIQEARKARTEWFFTDRNAFMCELSRSIGRASRAAARRELQPVFRLNGTSDIRWETVGFVEGGETFGSIMERYPNVQFYDYTKLPNRKRIPPNYHLTFSLSEDNGIWARQAFKSGMNVAVVFSGKALPETFQLGPGWTAPVVDGDTSDLRFLDPTGSIVGLRAKGRARGDLSGFVYRPGEPLRLPLEFRLGSNA